MAYATSLGARLPSVTERLLIVRGIEKRPYPWGEPFGSNNANTREEVVSVPALWGSFEQTVRPMASGISQEMLANGSMRSVSSASTTPDLGSKTLWLPGPTRALGDPDYRGDDLGFRLVRDLK